MVLSRFPLLLIKKKRDLSAARQIFSILSGSICRSGETGRRARFRGVWAYVHVGSSPTFGIKFPQWKNLKKRKKTKKQHPQKSIHRPKITLTIILTIIGLLFAYYKTKPTITFEFDYAEKNPLEDKIYIKNEGYFDANDVKVVVYIEDLLITSNIRIKNSKLSGSSIIENIDITPHQKIPFKASEFIQVAGEYSLIEATVKFEISYKGFWGLKRYATKMRCSTFNEENNFFWRPVGPHRN